MAIICTMENSVKQDSEPLQCLNTISFSTDHIVIQEGIGRKKWWRRRTRGKADRTVEMVR